MEKVICTNCNAENIASSKYCSRCGHTLPQVTIAIPTATVQQSKAGKINKRNNLLGAIVGIIFFSLSYWTVLHFVFGTSSLDKQLNVMAGELNKRCPMMIDKETQLDNAVVMPGNIFQYNYTLVGMEKGNIDTVAIRNYILPLATNNVKTNPEMKYQRDNKITLAYYYRDKNGKYLFSFSVTPERYEN
jgi:hypothetical protein